MSSSGSVPTPTVPNVDPDDVVDPGDAAIQALLALPAENTHDHEKRDRLIDCILTLPPQSEWPPDSREKLLEACQFIKSLAEDLRQRSANDDDCVIYGLQLDLPVRWRGYRWRPLNLRMTFETLETRLFQDNVGDPPWIPGVTPCTTSTASMGQGYGRSH
jgi:hypothetical protein